MTNTSNLKPGEFSKGVDFTWSCDQAEISTKGSDVEIRLKGSDASSKCKLPDLLKLKSFFDKVHDDLSDVYKLNA